MRRVRDHDLAPLLGLAALLEVRADEHQARQLALRAGGRLQRDRVQTGHLGEDLLQAPLELERALHSVLLLQRMEVREARQGDDALVDARVVLHRARAERVEAGVDPEVALRELGEVADELELVHLGKSRRLGAPQLLGNLRRGQALVARDRRRTAPALRLLVDELHRGHLGEHLDEPVDLRRRALLGDGDEQHVVHALVVAADRVPGMDAALARRLHDVARIPSDANGTLLECCLIWKHQLEPGTLQQLLLRVGRERETGLPQLAQTLRTEPREVDEPSERQERLVRRDVRRRLLAADVLLARLQGEDIAALARGVQRLADDPSGHPPDEVRPAREEAVVRAAVRREVPGGLALAERDRAAVPAGCLEHAERQRVDVGDRERLGVVRRGGELRRRLEAAEDVRLLEDHGGGALGGTAQRLRIRRPAGVRHLDDLEAEAGCVRLHDLAHLRVRRLGDDDLRPAGRVLGDEARVGGDGRPVVARRVRDVHAR